MILRTTTIAALLSGTAFVANAAAPADVLSNYADIALAGYEDSLATAKTLKSALEALVAEPNDANLDDPNAAFE